MLTSLQRKSGLIFLGALLSRALFYHFTDGYTVDRAYVVFRYAENIAGGHGFVYNLGERVLGVWGPLYPFLLATLNLMSIPTPGAALLVALACSGVTAVVLFRFGLLLHLTRFAVLPAILYMFWPPSLIADVNGAEMALFTLLVTAAFYYHHKRLYIYATGLATLATLTRPEGLILLVLMVISGCRHDRACQRALVYTPIVLLVPWLVFAWSYFGTIVPQPLVVWYALHLPDFRWWWQATASVVGLCNVFGWVLLPTALLGLVWLNRTQNFGRMESAWLVVAVAWYGATVRRPDLAHAAAVFPLCLLLASAAVEWKRAFPTRSRILVTLLLLSTAIALTRFLLVVTSDARNEQRDMDSRAREYGIYLNRHGDVAHDRAFVSPVGYFGYFSGMRMIDPGGVLSPEMLPYIEADAVYDAVVDMKPDWVTEWNCLLTSPFITDSLLVGEYGVETLFRVGGLFHRKDIASISP